MLKILTCILALTLFGSVIHAQGVDHGKREAERTYRNLLRSHKTFYDHNMGIEQAKVPKRRKKK